MIKVYGLKVSYFTGKLESYLRYKEIPYEFCSMTPDQFMKTIPHETGAMQMPAVELDDGRWMTDTTPIIDWFEGQYPHNPVLPQDPEKAFLSRLIEDYADEWMWRPAMHYRWSFPASAKLLRRQIVDEMAADVPVPDWLKRYRTEKRQFRNFVEGDGVNEVTRAHVEKSYLGLLKILNPVFENRPFLFGERPSLADIGLMGPLFRHFAMDPTPGAIMRETAPSVMAWVYRLWDCKASRVSGGFLDGVPEDLLPLLAEIGATHLPNLCANAKGWKNGAKTFDVTLEQVPYTEVPVSQYRVWCLERLQERYQAACEAGGESLAETLDTQGCLEPLLRIKEPGSGYDPQGAAPFGQSIPVYSQVG